MKICESARKNECGRLTKISATKSWTKLQNNGLHSFSVPAYVVCVLENKAKMYYIESVENNKTNRNCTNAKIWLSSFRYVCFLFRIFERKRSRPRVNMCTTTVFSLRFDQFIQFPESPTAYFSMCTQTHMSEAFQIVIVARFKLDLGYWVKKPTFSCFAGLDEFIGEW